MFKKSNIRQWRSLSVALLLCAAASVSQAEVIPAPEHPGHHNITANSTAEHLDAARHHQDSAEYHHALALHHASLAREHQKLGHHKLAEHHQKLSKLAQDLADEHAATAKTHADSPERK